MAMMQPFNVNKQTFEDNMVNTRDFFISLCTFVTISHDYAITASNCGTGSLESAGAQSSCHWRKTGVHHGEATCHMQDGENVNFEIVVRNRVQHREEMTYSTFVVTRGILVGGMRTLMETSGSFKFTYHEDRNYGPFLVSVNGVSGSTVDRTYWELLVQKAGQEPERLDVGIGCYIPEENDRVIFNFTKW